jgi:hypothetical protein
VVLFAIVLTASGVCTAIPAKADVDYSVAVVANMYYEVEKQLLAPVDGKPHPFTLVWKDSARVVLEPLSNDWVQRIESPDGAHIASVILVARDSVSRFGLSIDGREVFECRGKLSHGGIGSWSANSAKYVFGTYDEVTGDAGLWEVYDIGGEGQTFKVRKIAKAEDSGHFVNPRYTPDGQFVSYIHDNWLRMLDLRTKRARALFHGAKAGVTIMTTEWSPGGNRVALGSFFRSGPNWFGRIAVLELAEP